MKILKIFGVVVGIHVFALILIFANPGCSSTTKTIPAPIDTASRVDNTPSVSLPMSSSSVSLPVDTGTPAFNPDAPALAAGGGVRFTPTRPGTPAATTLNIEPVGDVTPATAYTVTTGDNLWSLAKKFHVTTGEIAAANNLKTNAILRPGQRLLIPGKAASTTMAIVTPASVAPKTPEAAVARPAGETIKHVVKAGESLSAIASQYGVRQGEIAALNNIADPQRIRVGMELTIPGWQATSKAGKAPRPTATKTPAPKADAAPIFNAGPDTPDAPKPTGTDVPVIRVDDSPIAPAPQTP